MPYTTHPFYTVTYNQSDVLGKGEGLVGFPVIVLLYSI